MSKARKAAIKALEDYRKDNSLTREEVARSFGYSRPQWYRFVTGKAKIPVALAIKIERRTGIKASELVGL